MYDLLIFFALLATGYIFGQLAENRHLRSLRQRERDTLHVPLITLKTVPPQAGPVNTELVAGNVVVSVDYFKRFLAMLRNFFGGRVSSYETLLDRARREALMRMKEAAIEKNANMVVNVRIETASISKSSSRRNSIGSVEVFAYGTAVLPQS